MSFDELGADARLHRERILKSDLKPGTDVGLMIKRELAENVWPFLDALVKEIRTEVVEEIGDLGEAIDELIEREDSALHADLSAMIIGLFEHGKLIAAELEKLLPAQQDDLARKRLAEMIHAYRQGVEIVTERVIEVTIEIDAEGEGGGDEAEAAKTEAAAEADDLEAEEEV